MASADEGTPREERRKKMYGHDRSKKARGEDAKKDDGPAPSREGHADPAAADKGPLVADEVLGRHGGERDGLRKAHEAERRDEHGRQRDEHRAMNARHETEHESAKDLMGKVALHRSHEREKERLRREHEDRHGDMAARHQEERHSMHLRHEAEIQGAMGAGNAAANSPVAQAAGGEAQA